MHSRQRSLLPRATALASALALALAACRGAAGTDPAKAPEIRSFAAEPTVTYPGSTLRLVADFAGGEARIEPLGLAITAGVPLTIGPFSSGMTFTLVVSDGVTEARRDLAVPFAYRRRITALPASPHARSEHVAVVLADGRVLLGGGLGVGSVGEVATDLLDPSTGAFEAAGELAASRWAMGAFRRPDGSVLVAGGLTNLTGAGRALERWDPATGAWSAAGSLLQVHGGGTVSVIPGAGWLIAGGTISTAGAELLDPYTGTSRRPAGTMLARRSGHTATYVGSTRILLVGGGSPSAELYDSDAEAFVSAGELTTPRRNHVAEWLGDGEVLVAGGEDALGTPLASAERWNAVTGTGTFSPTGSLRVARTSARSVALATGEVLVAGGRDADGRALDSIELFDPATGTFTLLEAALPGGRTGHTLTRLPDGRILVVGGETETGYRATSVSIFD